MAASIQVVEQMNLQEQASNDARLKKYKRKLPFLYATSLRPILHKYNVPQNSMLLRGVSDKDFMAHQHKRQYRAENASKEYVQYA